jgi:hypothetical protein
MRDVSAEVCLIFCTQWVNIIVSRVFHCSVCCGNEDESE